MSGAYGPGGAVETVPELARTWRREWEQNGRPAHDCEREAVKHGWTDRTCGVCGRRLRADDR